MAKKGEWEVKVTRNHVPDRVTLDGAAWHEFLDDSLDELEDLSDFHIARLIYDTPEGEYKRTGFLAASGGSEIVGDKGVLYNEAPYAEHVHEGAQGNEPRPWLLEAMKDFHRRRLTAIALRIANGRKGF